METQKTPTPRTVHGPYRHGLRWRVMIVSGKNTRKRSYRSFVSRSEAEDFIANSRGFRCGSDDALLRHLSGSQTSKRGWVYAVSLTPEHRSGRIKVGFTSDVPVRVARHRTTNPTSVLLAAWEADKSDETKAHAALPGRVASSEVFVVGNLSAALRRIDRAIGPRVRTVTSDGDGTSPVRVRVRHATAKQPAPQPNGNTPIADLVIADVRARQGLGQRRYGVDLQANNGRDALVDAYQEAIDLAMYLRQLLEERETKS